MTTVLSNTFSVEVTTKKWNPGYYMGLNFNKSHEQTFADRVANSLWGYAMDDFADNPLIKGVFMTFGWNILEPTFENYDWSLLHQEINYLKSLEEPKHLWLHPAAMNTANHTEFNAHLPQYVLDAGGLATGDDNSQSLKYWEEEHMDSYIHFMEALAAEFDDEPYLEIVNAPKETSLGAGLPGNENRDEFIVQLLRLASAMNIAFSKTNLAIGMNHGNDEDMTNLVNGLRALSPPVGITFPDLTPTYIGDHVDNGEEWPMVMDNFNMIRGDLSGWMSGESSQSAGQPVFARAETSELGGNLGTKPRKRDGIAHATVLDPGPPIVYGTGYIVKSCRDFADSVLKASHIAVHSNNDSAVSLPEQQWTTGSLVEFGLHPTLENEGYPY